MSSVKLSDDSFVLRLADEVTRTKLSRLFACGRIDATSRVIAVWCIHGRRRLVGAIIAVPDQRNPQPHYLVDLYRLPGYEGSELDLLLLQKFLVMCPPDISLFCRTPFLKASRIADFLVTHKFQARDEIHKYEASLCVLASRVNRINRRLDRHRSLDKCGELVALDETTKDRVRLSLERANLMSSSEFDRLYESFVAHDFKRCSSIALARGKVIGILLVVPMPVSARVSIPVIWVHPNHRQSWVQTRLLQRSIQSSAHLSPTTIEFSGDTAKAPDTIKLANKAQATLLSRYCRFERVIAQ